MFYNPRYVASAVLALVVLLSAGHTHGAPGEHLGGAVVEHPVHDFIGLPGVNSSNALLNPLNALSGLKPLDTSVPRTDMPVLEPFRAPLSPRTDVPVLTWNAGAHAFIGASIEHRHDDGVAPPLPPPPPPPPPPPTVDTFRASLEAEGLRVSRGDPPSGPAVDESVSLLETLLRRVALEEDPPKRESRYKELHGPMFNERFSGKRGYELLQPYWIKLPTERQFHVYGVEPDLRASRFTRSALIFPAGTYLRVFRASGPWRLVAYSDDNPGAFVGWILWDESKPKVDPVDRGPEFLSQVIQQAQQHALSEPLVIEFVKHHESLRNAAGFKTAQAAIVEQAIGLASGGGSRVARLGIDTDMVYVNTGARIEVIDPRQRTILNLSDERANAMLGTSLLEHVGQQPPGARFFSAFPTKTDDLVFIIEHKHMKIPRGELTQDHIRALSDMLLSTAPGDSDVIFTAQPQLTTAHRERLHDILFQVADEATSRGRRVLVDDPSTTVLQRAAAIRNAQLQDPMVAFVADGSFKGRVTDANVIQNLEEQLVAGGVKVVHVDADGTIAPSVASVAVVITAHSDEELRPFIAHLISQKALLGKMVIFNTCGTKLTEALVHDMIHIGGSTGVYYLDGTILASQVSRFLRHVLQNRRDGSEPALMKAIEKSSRSQKLKGVWQISERLFRPRDAHV